MTDTNEIRFSGTIERLKSIKTKTGNSMVSFFLKVGKEKFKVIAFKNIADALLKCGDGAQVSVTGSGSINSWKDDKEHWHNDFQVSAWGVEISGQKIVYEKNRSQNDSAQQEQPSLPAEPEQYNEFDYAGGPF